MNIFDKQGFWVSLATVSLGIFTTFNTYQLKNSQAIYDDLQIEIRALNDNVGNLNGRIDNLYAIIAKNKEIK